MVCSGVNFPNTTTQNRNGYCNGKQFNACVCTSVQKIHSIAIKKIRTYWNRALGQYLRVKNVLFQFGTWNMMAQFPSANTEQFHANVEHLATLSYKMTIPDRWKQKTTTDEENRWNYQRKSDVLWRSCVLLFPDFRMVNAREMKIVFV